MAVKKNAVYDIVEYEYRKGITLGFDYEGVRLDIGMKVSTTKQHLEQSKIIIQGLVHDDLDAAAIEYMKGIELGAKAGPLARLYKQKGNEDASK